MAETRVTYFASTDYRNKHIPFGIKQEDREKHLYIVGKTGMGKSTFLENLAIQDIEHGNGMAFIDPHGMSAKKILEHIPEARLDDVIYFSPADTDYPIALNIFDDITNETRVAAIAALVSIFKRLWQDVWSHECEELMLHALTALSFVQGTTLFSVGRLLTDTVFRAEIIKKISDDTMRVFWEHTYEERKDQFGNASAALSAKLGSLSGNAIVRSILGQGASRFSFDDVVNKRRILIVNLAKGQIGDDVADFLGSIIIAKLYSAALARASLPAAALAALPRFYLYVDECHSIGRGIFADMLSEARKYKLCLTVAHQYLEQLDEKTRAAVFGNVGTAVVFRLGATDAETFETNFHGKVGKENFLRLGFAQIYVALMIDGVTSSPFSAVTLPPIKPPSRSLYTEVIARSRARYAKPKASADLAASIAIGTAGSNPATPNTAQVHTALGALGVAGGPKPPGAATMQGPQVRPPGAPGMPGAPGGPREIPEATLRDLLYVEEPLSL